jgi:phasin family protein
MTIDEGKTAEKVRAGARATKAVAAGVVDTAKDQFSKAAETQFKAVDDVAAFSKSTMDAFLKSGSIFFHGMEELTRTMVGLTQSQVESGMSAAKSLIAAKTLTEFTELQNAYAKTSFDNAVAEATRLSELAMRVTNDAIVPLSARLTATIEQISKPIITAA